MKKALLLSAITLLGGTLLISCSDTEDKECFTSLDCAKRGENYVCVKEKCVDKSTVVVKCSKDNPCKNGGTCNAQGICEFVRCDNAVPASQGHLVVSEVGLASKNEANFAGCEKRAVTDFVELINTGTSDIELKGVAIFKGSGKSEAKYNAKPSFTFAESLCLKAGKGLVIAHALNKEEMCWGADKVKNTSVINHKSTIIASDAAWVKILDAAGATIDEAQLMTPLGESQSFLRLGTENAKLVPHARKEGDLKSSPAVCPDGAALDKACAFPGGGGGGGGGNQNDDNCAAAPAAQAGELLISEIKTTEKDAAKKDFAGCTDKESVDFIEIVNNTDKKINLNGLNVFKGSAKDFNKSAAYTVKEDLCLDAGRGILIVHGMEKSNLCWDADKIATLAVAKSNKALFAKDTAKAKITLGDLVIDEVTIEPKQAAGSNQSSVRSGTDTNVLVPHPSETYAATPGLCSDGQALDKACAFGKQAPGPMPAPAGCADGLTPEPGDILITEVKNADKDKTLHNFAHCDNKESTDFIEIINTSDKKLNIKGLAVFKGTGKKFNNEASYTVKEDTCLDPGRAVLILHKYGKDDLCWKNSADLDDVLIATGNKVLFAQDMTKARIQIGSTVIDEISTPGGNKGNVSFVRTDSTVNTFEEHKTVNAHLDSSPGLCSDGKKLELSCAFKKGDGNQGGGDQGGGDQGGGDQGGGDQGGGDQGGGDQGGDAKTPTAGDIVLSEVNFLKKGYDFDSDGKTDNNDVFFEIVNISDKKIKLDGVIFRSNNGSKNDNKMTFGSLVLDSHKSLLVAQSKSKQENVKKFENNNVGIHFATIRSMAAKSVGFSLVLGDTLLSELNPTDNVADGMSVQRQNNTIIVSAPTPGKCSDNTSILSPSCVR